MKNEGKKDAEGIAAMPAAERPYERLEEKGAAVLSDAELLAVIITTGTRNSTAVDISREVLKLCKEDDIAGLRDVSLEELRAIKGIGRVKALQFAAVCELAHRMARKRRVRADCQDADSIGEMLTADMGSFNQEVFRTLILDKKLRLIGMKDIFVGTVDMAPVHPREVFSEAIKHLGSFVVLAHNHPSGDVKPSREDLAATKRMILAGRLLEIEVVDHIIVGSGKYYSMHLHGDIDRLKRDIERDISGRS